MIRLPALCALGMLYVPEPLLPSLNAPQVPTLDLEPITVDLVQLVCTANHKILSQNPVLMASSSPLKDRRLVMKVLLGLKLSIEL